MKHILIILFSFFALVAEADTVSEVLSPSAVVRTNSGSGTAIAIKSDPILGTYLVTNYHVVVSSLDDITVQFYGTEEFYPAYVHSVDTANDIAVLITRHQHPFIAVIGQPPMVFDEVYCVGASLGRPLAPSRGIITGTQVPLFPGRAMTRMDCGIVPGNSGGGLFVQQDGQWKYVGMSSMVMGMSLGLFGIPVPFLGVAVAVEDITAHLQKHGVINAP